MNIHNSPAFKPFYVYVGCGVLGVTIALTLGFLVQGFPSAVKTFVISDYVEIEPAPSLLADSSTFSDPLFREDHQAHKIPEELYPEDQFLSQEPFIIASSDLPTEIIDGEKHTTEYAPEKNRVKITPAGAVPPRKGLHHVVQPGENLWDIAQAYQIDYTTLSRVNHRLNPRRIIPGQKVYIPGFNDPDTDDPITDISQDSMILPFEGAKLVSGYGNRTHPIGGNIRFHRGVDFSAPHGTPVRSSGWEGDSCGAQGTLGLVVEIEHPDGLKTVYA